MRLFARVAVAGLLAREEIDGSRLVAYGRSIGGGAAAHRHVAALILESSLRSVRAFAAGFLASSTPGA